MIMKCSPLTLAEMPAVVRVMVVVAEVVAPTFVFGTPETKTPLVICTRVCVCVCEAHVRNTSLYTITNHAFMSQACRGFSCSQR